MTTPPSTEWCGDWLSGQACRCQRSTSSPTRAQTPSPSAAIAVAATEGILRIPTPEELEGVMAHELAHLQNRDVLIGTIAATFAGAISMIGNMLQWGAMGRGR